MTAEQLNALNLNTFFTCEVSNPHIVHVVSILEVPIKFGSTSFQSNEVNGAQKSEFLFCLIIV